MLEIENLPNIQKHEKIKRQDSARQIKQIKKSNSSKKNVE